MLFERIFAARRSDIVRFSDPDTFRPLEFASNAKSLPLDPRNFSYACAAVRLPACEIVMQHSFPRILDLAYDIDGILLVIPLDSNDHVVVNGESLHARSFLAVSGKAGCKVVEPKDNLFALIRLKREICDRGWLEHADRLHLLNADPAAMETVRRTLLAIIEATLSRGHDEAVAQALQEELLQALDSLWSADETRRSDAPASLNRYGHIVDRVDAWIAANPTSAIYSAELATSCGVSVRTLGSAVHAIRGINLHRYLRLKRLWRSRAQLAAAPSGLTVKACALANGFTHFGEFSCLYKTTFGEMASQTLTRGRA